MNQSHALKNDRRRLALASRSDSPRARSRQMLLGATSLIVFAAANTMLVAAEPTVVARASTEEPAAIATVEVETIEIVPRALLPRVRPQAAEETPPLVLEQPMVSEAVPLVEARPRSSRQLAQARRPYEDVFAAPEQANSARRQPVDDGLPVIVPQPVRSPSYFEVYRSVPFIEAEYLANPSYRHEATMELLFNQLRPMQIHKYSPPPPPPPVGVGYMTPYYYVRPGYRVNFNFWYPMPTVYRNY